MVTFVQIVLSFKISIARLKRRTLRLDPAVLEPSDEDVLRADLGQAVHDVGHALSLDEHTHGRPPVRLDARHGRCPPSRRKLGRLGQARAGDVVRAQNVLLGGEHSSYARLDEREDRLERLGRKGGVRFRGRDEYGLGLHESVDGVQTGSAHGVSRLCKAKQSTKSQKRQHSPLRTANPPAVKTREQTEN